MNGNHNRRRIHAARNQKGSNLMLTDSTLNGIERVGAATLAATAGSAFSSDELQTLLVSLLTLAVREIFYWWRNRKASTQEDTSNGG